MCVGMQILRMCNNGIGESLAKGGESCSQPFPEWHSHCCYLFFLPCTYSIQKLGLGMYNSLTGFIRLCCLENRERVYIIRIGQGKCFQNSAGVAIVLGTLPSLLLVARMRQISTRNSDHDCKEPQETLNNSFKNKIQVLSNFSIHSSVIIIIVHI